jgi:crotonobetainyl-CoA:carnitine CoA-transferase CaiB-like acyl-CoA transferase
VPMLQSLWAAEDMSLAAALNGGAPLGGPRPGMIVHAIKGRHVAVQFIGGGPTWNRLLDLMGAASSARDPRFATPAERREHWAELRKIIVDWLDGFASAEAAIAALTAARVPCAPVLSTAEVIAHPHMAARQSFASVPHPTRGEVQITSAPFYVDGGPVLPAGPAPYRAGEHTRMVLAEVLGYAPSQIEALLALKAVAAP